MVTVIATKEELTTPVKNGLAGADANDNERPLSFIKDYQEVDFHRLPSCKPLPDDLFGKVDGRIIKSSIQGTFFLQVDTVEAFIQIPNNQNEQTNNNNDHLILTLTDGVHNIKAITNGHIPSLNCNTKLGSKLLLSDSIPLKDGFLQLTHDNTKYQYGSSTYSRARSTRRGRGNGSYRSSYEGRRNSRYDHDDGDTNFFKRPPPKYTLMDFMTSIKLSNETESEKSKDRHENTKRRYNNEQYDGKITTTKSNTQTHYSSNNNNYNEIVQQDENDEQLDPEDDPSHANYRERRNPLPPRLQRAQEERSRRNTNRCYDELIPGNDLNSIYSNDIITNQSLSSSSPYIRHGDSTTYMSNSSSTGPQHATSISSYAQPTNIIAAVSSSTPAHLAYFQTNPNSLTYSLTGMPTPPFHNQTLVGPSYTNDHLTYCYGAPYGTPTYLPPTIANNYNGDIKNNCNTHSDNETATNAGSQTDENNDSGIKSETSTSEQKQTSSSNDSNTNFQEEKRRDSNLNPRPRWRVGDMCLARWAEDGEFYYATVVDIQPPFCTVMYNDYNNYDQVRFSDLKVIPRDQQYYSLVQPTPDLNMLAVNAYFPPRTNYYPTTIDGCIMMPEPPPFPFNSAGTLYMYPTQIPSISRSDRYNINDFQQQVQSNENIDSLSSPSKNSNDTSGVDSTTTIFSNDDNQNQDSSIPKPCSIADTPLVLVISEESRERSESTASLTSSKYDEEQLIKDEEEGTKK